MQDLNKKLGVQTAEYDVVSVSNGQGLTKRVALLGLLTADPTLYRLDAFAAAEMEPDLSSAE